MSPLIDKLKAFETDSSARFGDYWLFALVMRDADAFRWDLLVAAPWLASGLRAATQQMVNLLIQSLPQPLFFEIGRVIVLGPEDALTESLGTLRIQHEARRFVGLEVDGFDFALAVVFHAVPPEQAPLAASLSAST